MENSLKLVKLWGTLEHIKSEIDNVAIPLGTHLSLEDPPLMIALEEVSQRISEHFERYKLVAEVRRKKRGIRKSPFLFAPLSR
jgi:hypothetical protein